MGPCDPFFPWWGFGGGLGFGGFGFGGPHFTNITNITNITNMTNIVNVNGGHVVPPLAVNRQPVFSNAQALQGNIHVRQAVSTMAANQFGTGRVPQRQQPISPATLTGGDGRPSGYTHAQQPELHQSPGQSQLDPRSLAGFAAFLRQPSASSWTSGILEASG